MVDRPTAVATLDTVVFIKEAFIDIIFWNWGKNERSVINKIRRLNELNLDDYYWIKPYVWSCRLCLFLATIVLLTWAGIHGHVQSVTLLKHRVERLTDTCRIDKINAVENVALVTVHYFWTDTFTSVNRFQNRTIQLYSSNHGCFLGRWYTN